MRSREVFLAGLIGLAGVACYPTPEPVNIPTPTPRSKSPVTGVLKVNPETRPTPTVVELVRGVNKPPERRTSIRLKEATHFNNGRLYFYNDFPNLNLSISQNFLDELLSGGDGIKDGTAIAIFFTSGLVSTQQRNSYYSQVTSVWERDLVAVLGVIPKNKNLVVIDPSGYIKYDQIGQINPQTYKDLSVSVITNIKAEIDKLSGRLPRPLPENLRTKTEREEPIRISMG